MTFGPTCCARTPLLLNHKYHSKETQLRVYKVDQAITNAILRSGVQILSGWYMIDWTLTQDADEQIAIKSVTIEKDGEMRTIVCDVLLNFHEKTINLDAFLAFCRAGLIFNDSLIIDPECRTNDPFIFAAGTVTKYSKKFRAESSQHIYFSSAEVGERLAEILRRVVDVQRNDKETSELWQKGKTSLTHPVFRAPVVIACILPGNYYYLHVRKPGKEISCETAINQKSSGEVFVTGSCTSKAGYFRIRLNLSNSVDTVTCVSKKTFEVQDMIALYGKHESMLNELKFRFKKLPISDFYSYFHEPWAAAIFHDRFERMRAENRGILLSQMCTHSLVDDCMCALIMSEWQEISEQHRRYIESRYAGSVYHGELEDNLMKFLEFYETELPMYCTPFKQRQMYMDIEESPLYFEQ
ncbi:cilia- and flagella-associated protein 61-like isoform X2 [Odontomachus brunneus]|uniref:cilia- and flagella-associated protein 61-like isoform X2 n=1 Tax=Odontomachus brunneus TaxID=486640 RepID=UPI0013F29863|nr:cilia- and flagella-associated protein 61-like isoform X2 [Odontomachus brunneus]